MILKKLPSGTIDIVTNGPITLLQFNCGCLDALPYCRAMCCRSRLAYNTSLTQIEIETNKFEMLPGPGGMVLQTKVDNDWECHYLGDDCKCKVHEDKPENCKNWHCSPGGPTKGITVREKGFVLLPSTL